jgi:methylmalonyl-CoA mutase cobalamin-binding domain/chain
MKERANLLEELGSAVSSGKKGEINRIMTMALGSGITSSDIYHCMLGGLDHIRLKVLSNDASLPDLLLCIDTVTEGLNQLSSHLDFSWRGEKDISLVIGVVEGDPHTLGKNIIAAIHRTWGYQVIDLGAQVSKEEFVQSVQDNRARILGLSTMMSTTMAIIPDIIKEVKAVSPETAIMIGGAPLNEVLAKAYGADGYAESAVSVLEQTDCAMKRFLNRKPWLSSNPS